MGQFLEVPLVGRLVLLCLLAQLATAKTISLGKAVLSSDYAMMCPAEGKHFSYNKASSEGPSHWSEISACCGGSRQSPRILYTINSISICAIDFPSFGYQGPQKVTGQLFNKGHDPVLDIATSDTAFMVGAPHTTGRYALSNMHLHFRTSKGHGSEHAINGQYFDAELHMVHYKEEYGSVAEAVLHEDGLLVIAFMLEVTTGTPNHEIVRLTDAIAHVQGIGKAGTVTHEVDLSQLLPSSPTFFTYAGSLTTPPCSESVRWVVMAEPLKMHSHQLDILTSLKSSEGGLISDQSNDRPVQIGDTQVETNFPCKGISKGHDEPSQSNV